MERTTGRYIESTLSGEAYRAFIPAPLPPDPPIQLSPELLNLHEKANRALGRLDGVADVLPDADLFLYQYVRKEAVLSSQIEGTQSSLSDLLLFEMDEAPGTPLDDVREVSSYVRALDYGLKRMREGFPLSLRLLREIHAVLLDQGRGAEKQPGEFRRTQVWLGGSTPGKAIFVPPPPDQLMACLDPFERFLHDDPIAMPVLLKAALAHVQFETIHPFLDGNGRLGRLLITLLLLNEKVLNAPLLYLSLYFKTRRSEYYERLQQVRIRGDWEGWLGFFLQGIFDTAQQAVSTARELLRVFESDRERIRSLGRIAGSCLQVHELLMRRPIRNIADTSTELGINRTTISNCFKALQAAGITREITGKRRNRLFVYDRYLNLLSEGTEPLA